MKNRAIAHPSQVVTTNRVKATGVETVDVNRPNGGYDILTIWSDKLNGDHVTVYSHNFKKTLSREYHGNYFRDNSTETLSQVGKIQDFTRFVGAEPSSWDYLYNNALADMYEQLRSSGVGDGLDLSVSIAEAAQVRKMITQVVGISNYVRSFSPRNWAKKWLEYQYGWKPLVSDLYNTFDALMHRRTHSYVRVYGKARDRSDKFKVYKNLSWPGSIEDVYWFSNYRTLMCCEFEIKNSAKQQLAGYTSLNPVSIAWELTPYSFIVDWVVDIGGYLRSLETALLYATAFKRGWIVYGYKSEHAGTLSGGSTVNSVTSQGHATAFVKESFKWRQPVGAYPLPVLPPFKADFGWQRMTSAISLLSLHLKRG